MDDPSRLSSAISAILSSPSRKRLVVAGPGTGKTSLFKKVLEGAECDPSRLLVLTFLRNLQADLQTDLGALAEVFTLVFRGHDPDLTMNLGFPGTRSRFDNESGGRP